MLTSTIVAQASPTDEAQNQEFAEWLSQTHIPEMRNAIPEITTVSHHKIWNPEMSGLTRYFIIYTVEGLTAADTATKLGGAAPGFTQGPIAVSGEHAVTVTFANTAHDE